MIKDINFINGIIKSREKYLLSYDDFCRMAESTADEAIGILRERGFGGDISEDVSAEDYEKLIFAEWDKYVAFLREYAPSKDFFTLVCAKNDFFNAECALRQKALGIEEEDMFLPFGSVDTESLKKAAAGEYDRIPDHLAAPMKAAAELFDREEATGAKTGTLFLRAYYAFMLKRVKNKLWKESIAFEIDVKNVSTALRSKNSKVAEEYYFEGGAIKRSALALLADKNEKKALDKFVRTPYYELVKIGLEGVGSSSMAEFEKLADDLPTEKIKEKRFETEGVFPSLVYWSYVTNALKNARLVMAMLLVGADKEEIKKRLRECYAK